ncbi:hypothetical protein SEEN2TTA_15419 [Salmonella enterica subsp. enterica serovar Newport str. Pond080-2TTA]|nr:hypothetical protein SEEN2TTA_15419 [Salmonella enterica subsp. enterica serovar Newport str. Pond080-2TTA]
MAEKKTLGSIPDFFFSFFISEFQCENEIYLACQSMNVCLFIINDLLISF